MKSIEIVLLAVILFFMGIHVISAMIMCYHVSKNGERINLFLLRWKLFSYIKKYKIMMQQKSGYSGSLYYSWIISANLALVALIIMVLHDLFPSLNEYMIVINNTWFMNVFTSISLL
jgi:hypothetical protein